MKHNPCSEANISWDNKKFPAIYGIPKSITVTTPARQLPPIANLTKPVRAPSPHPTSRRPILILRFLPFFNLGRAIA